MSSFYIYLPPEAAERLREVARRELRSPAKQATVLLLAALGEPEAVARVSVPSAARRRRKPDAEAA